MTGILLVEKEQLKDNVSFVQNEVLKTKEEQEARRKNLEKAMVLGNSYKGKIRIVFATEEGDRAVETTVWAATEHMIQLKGGVSIPVRAIKQVII